MSDKGLALINIYDIEDEKGLRHLIALVEPVLAGAMGIDEKCIVGEFRPAPDGGFDPQSFVLNRTFVEAVERYLNEEIGQDPEVVAQALEVPGQALALIDPRSQVPDEAEPPPADILGHFEVDAQGKIVPESFQYNRDHVLFDPFRGLSGLLEDQRFYNWLHPETKPQGS